MEKIDDDSTLKGIQSNIKYKLAFLKHQAVVIPFFSFSYVDWYIVDWYIVHWFIFYFINFSTKKDKTDYVVT